MVDSTSRSIFFIKMIDVNCRFQPIILSKIIRILVYYFCLFISSYVQLKTITILERERETERINSNLVLFFKYIIKLSVNIIDTKLEYN